MPKHVLLIREPGWAGPTPVQLKGPTVDLTRGRLESVSGIFEFVLEVDSQTATPLEFQPLDVMESDHSLLFSSRFQQVLADVGVDNVQYFPAKVIYKPTGKEMAYRVANIIGTIRALDVDASDCTVDDDGFVEDIESLVLNEDVLRDTDFIRLEELWSVVVISERVADAIERMQVTGVRIIQPEEWVPGMI